MISERQLSEVLSEFARTLLTDFPIQGILDQLVVSIVDVLPVDAAGVSLISPTIHPQIISGSDESADRYERLQSELGEGPCIAAYETVAAIAIPDLTSESRFPTFVERALAEGLAAVFTFPLRNGDRALGALDLYRKTTGSLDERDLEAAQTLADVTTSYLLNAQARVASNDFVNGVGHELRTPMASIAGHVELLRDEGSPPLTPSQEFHIRSIEHSVDRLAGLADDLLVLAVVSESDRRRQASPLDLVAVIASARETLGPAIEASALTVTFEVPDGPVMILGTTEELESLVLNLLTNALKFTEDGGWVRCRLRSAPGSVSLEVRDNGLGIPDAEQARLFSRFFRSSTAKRHNIQGTGLGLTIVESIVTNLGGDIFVNSKHLEGSTFIVTLPLYEAQGSLA